MEAGFRCDLCSGGIVKLDDVKAQCFDDLAWAIHIDTDIGIVLRERQSNGFFAIVIGVAGVLKPVQQNLYFFYGASQCIQTIFASRDGDARLSSKT